MRLYEFEGKDLAKKYGIDVPNAKLAKNVSDAGGIEKKVVIKAQVLSNKRAKNGLVKICENGAEISGEVSSILNHPGEKVISVLIEDFVEIKKEYYLSMTYDTDSNSQVLVFSKFGGIDVEETAKENGFQKIRIDPLLGLQDWQARQAAIEAGFGNESIGKISSVLMKAYQLFSREDARLLEINPLAETEDSRLIAVGTLSDLDDDAAYKHKDRNYPPREVGLGRELNEREIEVKKANAEDYRGTVKYLELDGDIGFLAAGGGGSMACMDALIFAGGSPANYAEHSGDPPKEKVYQLTKAILSKKSLNGLWIVGAIANFTRIDVTMQGIVQALEEFKPKFPIMVRRSGPFEKEGLQMLRDAGQKYNLDLEIYGSEMPMTATAELIVKKAKKFKETHHDNFAR